MNLIQTLTHFRLLLSGWPRPAVWARSCAWGLPLLLTATAASAQYSASKAVTASDRAALAQIARSWLTPALESTMADNPSSLLRAEVIMGALDSRLRLAPCQRIEPFLPPGTRLWGRSRVGLRCLEGRVRWKVYVPVTVKAWGPAWVLRQAVPGGKVLTQDDADVAEIDWAARTSSVLATAESWIGQQAAFALQPGQALRANMVRPLPAFSRGAQVRVKSTGAGFHVVVSGQAMGEGVVGQPVRVKLSGGRTITGTVRPGQVVEVKL